MNFKTLLLKFFGKLGSYLQVLFEGALKAELEKVVPIAIKAVKQIAADPSLLSSGAKRDAAAAIILAELVGAQTAVATSTINLAIELAYQQFLKESAK
jgi:hypothetical protein